MQRTFRFRFSWVLPVAQLLLCAALLWPWRLAYDVQFRVMVHSHMPAGVKSPEFYFRFSPAPMNSEEIGARELTNLRLIAPELLNIPLVFTGLARWDTVPRGFIPEFWRALTWPFVGLIFWWIAGRGIDALLALRSRVAFPAITWIETAIASLVAILSGILCVSFFRDLTMRTIIIFPWKAAFTGFALWTLLGAVTVCARIAQWRLRRRLKADAPGQAVAI